MASLNTIPRRSVVAKSDRVCIDAPVPNREAVYKYVKKCFEQQVLFWTVKELTEGTC